VKTNTVERDLHRLEPPDAQFNPPFSHPHTGVGCVAPPVGAHFYPIFSAGMHHGTCTWHEGGRFIPGTINDYGGNAHAEYGPILKTAYPTAVWKLTRLYNNFNSGKLPNDCPAG